MQLNPNYPWYLQNSPVFTELYNGFYEVSTLMTPLDAWKIFYPSELNLAGLLMHAKFWGLATSWASLTDSLIYNDGSWAETYGVEQEGDKFWSGKESSVSEEWYQRYISMKAYIQGRPFNLTTIKGALEVLLGGGTMYQMSVTESDMECTVQILSDLDTVTILRGISSYDPTLLGKPVGIKVNYAFNAI